MTVGAILQISSYSVAQMITGRIIAGIGNGINTAVSNFFPQPILWNYTTITLQRRYIDMLALLN
jgi:hypothetical protein